MAEVNLGRFILLGIFAVVLFRFLIYPAILSPLAKIPNAHWSCSISPVWMLWARRQGRENDTLSEAHKKHGPIVRLAPNEISINNMDAVKTVYQGGFDKHSWYNLFNNYGVPCMFSSTQAGLHSMRKRMLSHIYSKTYVNSSMTLSAQCDAILNRRLLPEMEQSASDGTGMEVNADSLFAATAMDFISAYCFGLKNSTNFIQDKEYRDHWHRLYHVRKTHAFIPQELPGLAKALRKIGVHLNPMWVDGANAELEAWCKEHCDTATEYLAMADSTYDDSVDNPVVLRALRAGIKKEEEANGTESPLYSTAVLQRDTSVASELLDHLLAGQETAGITLTYLAWHLSIYEDMQSQLRKELLSLTPNMCYAVEGGVALPDANQLDGLPLLHACIMETIRRYAPAGGPEPRVVPHPSCRIGPFEVPGGVRVSASAYCLHRNEQSFPCHEMWSPDRWLKVTTDGRTSKVTNRQFWGFSSGGRMCLGSNFAMHEMKLVIAAIYSNYTSYVHEDYAMIARNGDTASSPHDSLWLKFARIPSES